MISPSAVSKVSAALLASVVEMVEAFTIVLAVGLTRNWRSTLTGTGLALAVLVILVMAFGSLFRLMPLEALRLVLGVLLLFGMRSLRKALLRAAGVIPLHDEALAFACETDLLQRQAAEKRADVLATIAAFKAVLLEGVEVVFIVIAVGPTREMTAYAAIGAVVAMVLVFILGAALRRPLTQVPENTLKFAVGLMMTAFGIFWTGEGLGLVWPGADFVLIAFLVLVGGVSRALVLAKRRALGAA
ncbi:MAG: hypothetical protein WCS20_10950 [Alphaproteobacteria bacterium]